jgi:hypothetical protein
MNYYVAHNNFHRSNHHTISLSGYPESSKDPIASFTFPYQGVFYNNFYKIDGGFEDVGNSYEWWSAYTTTKNLSSVWDKYITTYTTVCSNSAFWNEYSKVYTIFKPLSSNWQSTFSTLCANIEYWNAVYDTNTVFSNKVQQYTRQKTSTNLFLFPSDVNNIVLDLSAGQVSTYITDQNSYFSDFSGGKKGGIYYLILVMDASIGPISNVSFNPNKFKIENEQYNISQSSGVFLRKFQFFCDGEFLHGKYSLYQISTPPPIPDGLVTLVDKYQIKTIGGNIILQLSDKGILNFNDNQMFSFNDEELYPF